MKKLFAEFKDFIAQGNAMDLAVGIVLGVAFKAVIDTIVNRILLQLIAAIAGKPSFNDLYFTLGSKAQALTDAAGKPVPGNPVHGTPIYYGELITSILGFVIVGFALFIVVKSVNVMQNARRRKVEAETAAAHVVEVSELDVLLEIRDALRNRPA